MGQHGDRRNKGALRACAAGAGGHARTRWSTAGAADRSDGSDSARAAVPGPLAGQPRFSRRVGRPGGAARRRSGGGRDGGWGLRVAAVAGCGTADRFAG